MNISKRMILKKGSRLCVGIGLALAFTLALPPDSCAQVGLDKVGQSTMTFLKVSLSPKAAGMGNARTAVGTEAEGMFYNPAAIAGEGPSDVGTGTEDEAARYSAFLTNTQWIADINHVGGAFTARVRGVGTFGVSMRSVNYGQIKRTELLSQSDPKGFRETGTVDVGAYAVGLTYARRITEQFSMGVMVQYGRQSLGQSGPEGGMVDNRIAKLMGNVGVKFFPGGYESFRFAMTIRNFSTGAQYEEISAQMPMVFRVGTGIDVLEVVGSGQESSLLLSAEFLHPNDHSERVNVGGEYTLLGGLISARAGYEFNYDLQGLSGGFGIRPEISGVQTEFSYSYSTMDVFSGVNRLSLGVSF
jgi:hypothetical protein